MAKNKGAKGNPSQHGCGPEGSAKHPLQIREDRLKNRNNPPKPADMDNRVTLAGLVAPPKRGQDEANSFSEGKGATISGYLADAHYNPTGETCNCGSTLPDMKDIHVEIVADPKYLSHIYKNKRVIAELTRWFPNLRKQWTESQLQQNVGKKITITGWLFYDQSHIHEAENTNPGGAHNWRATSWEIHPITSIKIG